MATGGAGAEVHHGFWLLRSMTRKSMGLVLVVVVVVVITTILTNSELSGSGNYFTATFTAKETIHSSVAHPRNPRPNSKVALILQRLLRDKYPECQLFPFSSEPIRLRTMGYYENSSDPVPPYDHISCFIMKARYNCAYRPNAPFDMAHQHELVLQLLPNTTKRCYLKALIGDTLEEWSTVLWNTHQSKKHLPQQQKRYHVMIHGNSYLRQIFEALVCKVMSKKSSSSNNNDEQQPQQQPHQSMVPLITDFSVQLGGPGIAVSDVTARQNRRIDVTELGQPLDNITLLQTLGCHGESRSDLSAYYRRKAVVPPNLAHCNDNIGMVELGHEWRFYYLFQPTMYTTEALETIYQERFGVFKYNNNNNKTDSRSSSETTMDEFWLLWNSVRQEAQNITFSSFLSSSTSTNTSTSSRRVRQISLESWLWTLRDLQLRDLGIYFGANNPWVSKPPDYHACMPGTPDDQVNLMLYLLWSGYDIVDS